MSTSKAKQTTRVVDHSKLSQSPPSTPNFHKHTQQKQTQTQTERERVHTTHHTQSSEREREKESWLKAQSFVAFLLLLLRFDREKEKRYTKV
jgi:hypothetical protein